MKRFILLLFLLPLSLASFGQEEEAAAQTGAVFSVHKSINGVFLFANYIGIRDRINDGNTDWRRISYSNKFTFYLGSNVDFETGFALLGTRENDNTSTREVSPFVNVVLKMNLTSRFYFELNGRAEFKNIYYKEIEEKDNSAILSSMFQTKVSLNQKNYFQDKNLYAIADINLYLPLEDIAQTYLNQFRLRAGIGYRSSFSWRYELRFSRSGAKNTLEGDFENSVNLLEFTLRYYVKTKTFND